MADKNNRDETSEFRPIFDEKGLIPCIAIEYNTKETLMFAFMNEEALQTSISTGIAHYWSRSRQSLWKKGETSGQLQKIVSMRTDCDQDCMLIEVDVQSAPAIACHTGRKSCFYRSVPIGKDQNIAEISLRFED